MRSRHCLPALALLLLFPVRGDDNPAAKAPAGAESGAGDVQKKKDVKKDLPSCCAGEEKAGKAEKAQCPRMKEAASPKTPAAKTAPAPSAPAPSAAAPRPEAAGALNMVVTRDPETGALRNATAAEREALLGRRPLASAEPEVVTLPDGTKMMRLGPDQAMLSVARKNPDGTVTSECVHGAAAAAAFVEGAAPPTPAPAAREK